MKVHKLLSRSHISRKPSGKLTGFERGCISVIQMPKIFNMYLISEMSIALPLWLSCLCGYFWKIVAHSLFVIALH